MARLIWPTDLKNISIKFLWNFYFLISCTFFFICPRSSHSLDSFPFTFLWDAFIQSSLVGACRCLACAFNMLLLLLLFFISYRSHFRSLSFGSIVYQFDIAIRDFGLRDPLLQQCWTKWFSLLWLIMQHPMYKLCMWSFSFQLNKLLYYLFGK